MAGEDTITVRCSCGKKLKAPATSAGKKARCPACGGVMLLTPMEIVSTAAPVKSTRSVGAATATATVARTSPRTSTVSKSIASPSIGIPADDDGGLGAMYELAEQAETAAPPDVPHCPSCRTAMEKNAVLCTNCGYDSRTGKSLATKKEAPVLGYANPKNKTKGPVDMMAPQGSFIVGLIVASVFGVVCSVLWIVIMFVTGYELGILATVVGWTVGLGMQIGQKGYSRRGGISAAIIAALSIVGWKILLLLAFMALTHSNSTKNGELAFELFHPLSILFVILGIGAAFRTANGSSK